MFKNTQQDLNITDETPTPCYATAKLGLEDMPSRPADEVVRENVIALTKSAGIIPAELARRLGVSRALVTLWFKGAQPIGPHYYKPIADILGYTVAELFLDRADENVRKRLSVFGGMLDFYDAKAVKPPKLDDE